MPIPGGGVRRTVPTKTRGKGVRSKRLNAWGKTRAVEESSNEAKLAILRSHLAEKGTDR